MRPVLLLALGAALSAAAPLHIAAVVRQGLPPYEGPGRLYRLTGEGALELRPGQRVTLLRPGREVRPGRLQVVESSPGGALARLETPGDHFPLIGDLALTPGPAHLPPLGRTAAPGAPTPEPPRILPVRPPALMVPLYFLKGDGSVSPGGHAKLRAWAASWPRTGPWRLLVSRDAEDPDLPVRRVDALRAALQGLGITQVAVEWISPVSGGPHEAIYLSPAP